MPTPNLTPSKTTVITDKGTKGLLKWIQSAMPDFYRQLSPQLVARQKSSNAALQGLGCARDAQLASIYAGNYSSRAGMGDLTNYSSYATVGSDIYGSAPTDLTIAPSSTTTDASSVASSAPTSGSLASAIQGIAQGIAVGTVAYGQVQANNTLLAANLARAQQGLPPLGATTTATGMISVGSSSTLLLVGIAALAFFAMSGKKSPSS